MRPGYVSSTSARVRRCGGDRPTVDSKGNGDENEPNRRQDDGIW